MPNLRTTTLTKKKAHQLVEGDLIKFGGKWWVVDSNQYALGTDRRHIHFILENGDRLYDKIGMFCNPLQKFKVRTAK